MVHLTFMCNLLQNHNHIETDKCHKWTMFKTWLNSNKYVNVWNIYVLEGKQRIDTILCDHHQSCWYEEHLKSVIYEVQLKLECRVW